MRLRQEKLSILRSLWFTQASHAFEFHRLSPRQRSDLLLWLDHSGLALYFLHRLKQAQAASCVPEDMLEKLEGKLQANRHRTRLLVEQLAEAVGLLEARGIPYAVLKGFSLSREFCADPVLRHQTDIDLLLRREDVPAASAALATCGYSRIPSLIAEEFAFSTPLLRTPSRHDDIYSPRERKVEIHLSIWDDIAGISVEAPRVYLRNVHVHSVMGVKFCVLPLEQAFLMQCLHLFRHLVGGWVRPSWIYEIAHFLNGSQSRRDLYSRIIDLVPPSSAAHVCGLSLAMAAAVFRSPVPALLQSEFVATMPEQSKRWVEAYAERFLLADLAGTKIGLLVERPFAADSRQWRAHVVRRVLPFQGRPRLGPLQAAATSARWRHRAHQTAYILGRLKFHVIAGLELGWEALRARRRLRAARAA